MAEVHFDPSIKISIPKVAFLHARRFLCSGIKDQMCDCKCHFGLDVKCDCEYKGRGKDYEV